MSKQQMYIYDVRGIQDYIFRTNKMKEIIGASKLVESLIINLFIETANEIKSDEQTIVTDISPEAELQFRFDETNTIDAEIMYYGGGNLLVLYNDREFAERVSRKMSIKLTKATYSLHIAYAGVEIGGINTYKNDYKKLMAAMDEKKNNMPPCIPVQSFPITLTDPLTGYSFSSRYQDKMCTYEAGEKLRKFQELVSAGEVNAEKIDEFGTEKGESRIAVVHIDGNSMGNTIKEIMEKITDYVDATKEFRNLSARIQEIFVGKALKSVEDNIELFAVKAELEGRTKDTLYRKIIGAGDDITFICNARIAMNCVRMFMQTLTAESEYTACAGIYVTHSKFPFARAYQYTEELCGIAKEKSRKHEGNYVDFQIRFGAVLDDIKSIRSVQYTSAEGNALTGRPYLINSSCEVSDERSLDNLLKMTSDFNKKKIARTRIKDLREMFMLGTKMVETELKKINSRLSDKLDIKSGDYQRLFDAIDIMDLKWEATYDSEENSKH